MKIKKIIIVLLIINILLLAWNLLGQSWNGQQLAKVRLQKEDLNQENQKLEEEISENLIQKRITQQEEQKRIFLRSEQAKLVCGDDFEPGIYFVAAHHLKSDSYFSEPVNVSIKTKTKSVTYNPQYTVVSDFSYQQGIFKFTTGDEIVINQGSGISLNLENADTKIKEN